MTTLGDWKAYVSDNWSSAADGQSDRVILRWINSALRKLITDNTWSFYKRRARINLNQAEAGVAITTTQASRLISLGGAEIFKQKYVDEQWDLHFDDDTKRTYRLKEVLGNDTQQARMIEEHKFVGASLAAAGYKFVRSVYPLPDRVHQVLHVQLDSLSVPLVDLLPSEFDDLKQDQPTLTGEPTHYTVRGGNLEVWPALDTATTLSAVALSLVRRPKVYTLSDSDDEELDWDDRYDDLLEAALDLEIATKGRGSTQLDAGLSLTLYTQRLATNKATDQGAIRQRRTMKFGSLGSFVDEHRLFRRRTN